LKQTKPGWQKQNKREQNKEKNEREKMKEFRKPIVEENMKIARIMKKKQEEKEDLIEIKTVE